MYLFAAANYILRTHSLIADNFSKRNKTKENNIFVQCFNIEQNPCQNAAFCGRNTNEGVYQTDYLNTYGELVLRDGVSLTNIVPFTNRHFNTTTFSSFVNTINSGGIVMTDVKSDIPNSSHNVAVVGYHPDGTLIYMDPEKGTLQEAPLSMFIQNYTISITSCKD